MQETETSEATIVRKLLNLKLSAQTELNEIVKLAAAICDKPISLIALTDDDTIYVSAQTGIRLGTVPLVDGFCNYALLGQGIMEVKDTLEDTRFAHNPVVRELPHIRYYAGATLFSKTGEKLGALCVMDLLPGTLGVHEQKMLAMLASHVGTILNSELNLQELQEEVIRLQDSEIHLKQIFEHSLTSFILVNPEMVIKVFNESADKFIRLHNNNSSGITQGANLISLLPADKVQAFTENIKKALEGVPVFVQQMHIDTGDHELWWELKFRPAFNMYSVITGVVIEAEDISERIRYKKAILEQNRALREITRVQSHEVRHPVVNMMSLVNLLSIPEEKEHYGRYLLLLKKELENLDQKIRNIVDMAS